MNEESLPTQGIRLVKALPFYLVVQGVVLLITLLDLPVYQQAYQTSQTLLVTGWFGVWLVLLVHGLGMVVLLLTGPNWKVMFAPEEWTKLVAGHSAGVLAGLISLGLRFSPFLGAGYFLWVAGLAVLLAGMYWAWRRRRVGEIFP